MKQGGSHKGVPGLSGKGEVGCIWSKYIVYNTLYETVIEYKIFY